MLTLLAIQILNLSIYNTEFYEAQSSYTENETSQESNPVDSFAELIVESVDGYENAFPETEQQGEKQAPELKHNITFKMIYLDRFARIPEKITLHYDQAPADLPVFQNNYSFLFWKEINHPPA